jgi:hypothetical protein
MSGAKDPRRNHAAPQRGLLNALTFALHDAFGRLVDRYAHKRKLLLDGIPAGDDQDAEMVRSCALASVVFDAGGERERRFVRRVRERRVDVRLVEVRAGGTLSGSRGPGDSHVPGNSPYAAR